MAQRITDAEADAFARTLPGTKPVLRRYPWQLWCDGHWWRIERGEDFGVTGESMRASLYNHASRHGGSVFVRQRKGTLVFRFQFPPTAPRPYRADTAKPPVHR